MGNLKQCILELLEQSSRLPVEEIACLLNAEVEAVAAAIRELEESRAILKYSAVIDWEKNDSEKN